MKNLVVQALKPRRLLVMLKKVGKRFLDDKGMLSNEENLAWIKAHCSRVATLAMELDPTLWGEAAIASQALERHAKMRLENIPFDLGGGGIYPFLYFLTRLLQPHCIVETGVAAGFSSYAFLSAIKVNGRGKLYSSDFPYFRLAHPEKYIGVVVEESLKDNWELYIDGDEKNLPRILSRIHEIDIFHYDSDKSYSGRKFAMSMIESVMSEKGIILMDDIQDNSYFHDYVTSHGTLSWKVFEFHGKYIGMIGKLTKGDT